MLKVNDTAFNHELTERLRQTSVIHNDVLHRYNIDSTGLTIELPEAPQKVDLSDLPSWFHSQLGSKFGYVAKTSKLNIVISAWLFTSFLKLILQCAASNPVQIS